MNRLFAAIATAALLSAPMASAPAQAQTPQVRVGAKVVDSKGKAVGQVERIISGPNGQPLQVLVRVDRILRTLPADALAPAQDGYASVLSRAEIAALPPSE